MSMAQTSLTVVWSVLGVLALITGSRRASRPTWLVGSAIMAVVLAKLLLVDRTYIGNLSGIVSFVVVGLLFTTVGYFAPTPTTRGDQRGHGMKRVVLALLVMFASAAVGKPAQREDFAWSWPITADAGTGAIRIVLTARGLCERRAARAVRPRGIQRRGRRSAVRGRSPRRRPSPRCSRRRATCRGFARSPCRHQGAPAGRYRAPHAADAARTAH
jgi:hypothetical protein